MANLRIIYQNMADISTAVITTSSEFSGTTTPVGNLTKDTKSLVWRSANTVTTAYITINFVAPGIVLPANTQLGIILCNTNLTSSATLRAQAYSSVTTIAGGQVTVGTALTNGDTGTVLANPYQSSGFNNWSSDPYALYTDFPSEYKNRKVFSRVFTPNITAGGNCKAITLTIVDTGNPTTFVEASRLIIGPVWSPTYNTSYGLSNGTKDLSTSVRSDAGDLITSLRPKINTLSFDLKYLSNADRIIFNKIAKLCGTSRALFVSLFPDNTTDWEKEQLYQIYGKFTEVPGLENSILDMYSSTVSMEEV